MRIGATTASMRRCAIVAGASQQRISDLFQLFPAIQPYQTGLLDAGDGHCIYHEASGNPAGLPVAVVHGGPGAGCRPELRTFHDPKVYNIICFDQRGCGRSRPHDSLEANTTRHLVLDMERLRIYLGVDRWQLFGGSWGATLALVYAQAYPERVSSLILRGVFLLRKSELHWFYQDGSNWLFPEAYARFTAALLPSEKKDVIAAYHRRLTHPNDAMRLEAAKAWSEWEAATLSMRSDGFPRRLFETDAETLAFARIGAHYFHNGGFLERDGQILRRMDRLADVPGTIVQGRYDVITPPKSAYELHRAWPRATLRIVADAGHAITEPGIARELVAATERHKADFNTRKAGEGVTSAPSSPA